MFRLCEIGSIWLSKTAGLAARVEDFTIEDRPNSAQAGREIAKFFFLKAIDK